MGLFHQFEDSDVLLVRKFDYAQIMKYFIEDGIKRQHTVGSKVCLFS